MNQILKTLSRFNLIWIGIWAVIFLLTSSIGVIFGIVGLAEMQKQNPHALDNSIISYNLLYFLATLEPIVILGTLIVVVIIFASWPSHKQQNSREEKQ